MNVLFCPANLVQIFLAIILDNYILTWGVPFPRYKISTPGPCISSLNDNYPIKGTPKIENLGVGLRWPDFWEKHFLLLVSDPFFPFPLNLL